MTNEQAKKQIEEIMSNANNILQNYIPQIAQSIVDTLSAQVKRELQKALEALINIDMSPSLSDNKETPIKIKTPKIIKELKKEPVSND